MSDIATSSTTTPSNPTPDSFYDAAPLEPRLLYQGEILVDVPILIMPKPPAWRMLLSYDTKTTIEEQLERGDNPRSVRVVDPNAFKTEWARVERSGAFVMAKVSKTPALVLSQTCDVQDKEFVQVAPIFPAATDNPEHLDRLKEGAIFSAFYLEPHAPQFGEAFADFERMQAVHKSFIRRLEPEQHFRLAEKQVRLLQSRITRYFGRPNCYDVGKDRAPIVGTYLCVGCFYLDGRVTAVQLVENDGFTNCTTCGGRGWVLKGR